MFFYESIILFKQLRGIDVTRDVVLEMLKSKHLNSVRGKDGVGHFETHSGVRMHL